MKSVLLNKEEENIRKIEDMFREKSRLIYLPQ